MLMATYQMHTRGCAVCRAHQHLPCSIGFVLLCEGARRLTRQLLRDPRRARA